MMHALRNFSRRIVFSIVLGIVALLAVIFGMAALYHWLEIRYSPLEAMVAFAVGLAAIAIIMVIVRAIVNAVERRRAAHRPKGLLSDETIQMMAPLLTLLATLGPRTSLTAGLGVGRMAFKAAPILALLGVALYAAKHMRGYNHPKIRNQKP